MSPTLKKIGIALAVLLVVALAWWLQQPGNYERLVGERVGAEAPSGTAAPASAPPRGALPLIEVARAKTMPMRDEVQAVGSLLSRQSVSLRAQSSGRVTQVHFRDGQQVRKGQVLIQQDDQLQRAEMQQVQAELGLARANHQRNQELVAQGFLSQRGQDESAATLQVAQARLALARTALDRLQIKAPFDAVAGIGNLNVGDYLREGDEAIVLQDMDVMYVDFRLPERYLPQLGLGQPVQFSVDALPGETYTARTVAIDPLIDEQGRSISIRASLPNDSHRLRPGMFARASLVLAERPDAVVVPEEAILPSAGGASVVRIVPWPVEEAAAEDAAAYRTELVPVVLGARLPGLVEIKEGMAAGDVVMTAGQHRVNRSGQRVQVAAWPDA